MNSLNEYDCSVLEDALDGLLLCIQENIPVLTHTSSDTIMLNLAAITSAKKKLKAIRNHHTQHFSAQEAKVMCWAVSDLREDTQDFLSKAPLNDPDRNLALETQKCCSKLLRYFEALFAQDGIDIRKLLDYS